MTSNMKGRMMRPLYLILPLALGACVQPLAEYEPTVDPARSGPGYQADLAACRQIAAGAEAEYTRRANDEAVAGLILGALAGAAIGSAYGSDYTAEAAAWGALAGTTTGTTDPTGGPRRIIDRCMAGRGHAVLNDLGQG